MYSTTTDSPACAKGALSFSELFSVPNATEQVRERTENGIDDSYWLVVHVVPIEY